MNSYIFYFFPILKFYSIIVLLGVFFPGEYLSAQPQIQLPDSIQIYINNSPFNHPASWMDSLVAEASAGQFRFRIVAVSSRENRTFTNIRLPQFLKLSEVCRQIILYFSLISGEKEREKEILQIYPLFTSTAIEPFIGAIYRSPGVYLISVRNWPIVKIPDEPLKEEKELHNQVLNATFSVEQGLDEIPEEIFMHVAEKQKTSVDEVNKAYQKVVLWNLSR